MKVAIMQPYFFPYIGYWQLMDAVDCFVIYDDVNYIKQGWINRNKIQVDGSERYFHISICKASQNKKINQLNVDTDIRERKKTIRTIELAYKNAPNFMRVFPMAKEIILNKEINLADYLADSLQKTASYLGIKTKLIRSSEINKNNTRKGQDKILDICKILGADEYYNAIGGKKLYTSNAFHEKGIQLYFLRTGEIKYQQFKTDFISNLSILDIMMFNSTELIAEILKNYTLETD